MEQFGNEDGSVIYKKEETGLPSPLFLLLSTTRN